MEWMVYVVVGLAVGANFGYIVGLRRGMLIVGELIGGITEGINGERREVLASDKK